jgi:hypothetical protein
MNDIRLRVITYTPTFVGKHNGTRCKAWLTLYDRYLGHKRGLTLKELASTTGISYGSLAVSLCKWKKWRYVGYEPHPGGRRYHILSRGRNWLDRWQDTMPLKRYLNDLEKVNHRERS